MAMMKSGIKRTAEGFELTKASLGAIAALIAVLTGLASCGKGVFAREERILLAVQPAELRDTARSIRDTIGALRTEFVAFRTDELRRDAEQDSTLREIARDNLAVNCYQAKYPMPFCRNAQRPVTTPGPAQAGAPRSQ